MRFAYVTTFYPPFHFGGDGIVVRRFARALVRSGHEVTVVHDADTFELLGGVALEGGAGDDGVRVATVRGKPRSVSSLLIHQTGRPVVTAATLRAVLRPGAFDVIHFHNVSMIGGPGILSYGGDALKLYTAHEHWLVCPTHVLWRHNREPCDSRQCLRCVLHHRRPPQAYRYTGYMQRQLQNVDLFFAQTEFSRRKHAEFGFPHSMELLSPFLPDLPDPAPAASPQTPSTRPYVLFAGRLEEMKGLDDMIQAFKNDPPAELWIAGDGTHRSALELIAGDSPSIRFLGHIPNERIWGLMRESLAVLVPTVGYETFGFTALEAIRAGAPVVARRRGPLPEIVEQSGAGLLFDTADEATRCVQSLIDDPALRTRLGTAGKQAFAARWAESVVVPRYLARIEKLLEERERSDVGRKL